MNRKSFKVSVLLSLLFVVVYGGINRFTALRSGVGSLHFSWERFIPFVPLMIVPYMSIDLLFVLAPFACRDDRQLRTLARRIVAAILIAGGCFVLFPLRFAFDRPHVDGALGLIFNNFRLLDQPFNQFPSLHIALQMILLPVYWNRVRGGIRALLVTWFGLIAVSTVLTYQHHLIDVIGGAVLGAMCMQLFAGADEAAIRFHPERARIGRLYAVASAICVIVAAFTRPWGMLLLWPAMALGIVAAGYFWFGSAVYRKCDGQLSWTTRLLLGPVLIAQRLSLAYYSRKSAPWNRLSENVWIGRQLSSREACDAIEQGVRAVLDLTCEFSEASPFRAIGYLSIPVLDLTAPTMNELERALAFIENHRERGVVYVHCKAGYSRTAAIAAGYLIETEFRGDVETHLCAVRNES